MHIDGKQKHRVHIGGKFSFDNLPKDVQNAIKIRLAERDPTTAKGFKGVLPGIKIDGKVVTKDNIKDFEIKSMKSEVKSKELTTKKKFSKSDLQNMGFKELKKVGKTFGTTDRSKSKLINEILELQ